MVNIRDRQVFLRLGPTLSTGCEKDILQQGRYQGETGETMVLPKNSDCMLTLLVIKIRLSIDYVYPP